MNTNSKAAAILLLLFGGMASALGFGVLSLILCAVGGGMGAIVIPLVIYAGVCFAEKHRDRFREIHSLNSAAFIGIAELPSVIVSGILLLVLICTVESKSFVDIAGDVICAAIAVFSGGVALLIMLGTIICSAVTACTRKKLSSQLSAAEEKTEV